MTLNKNIIALEEARQNLASLIDHTLLKPDATRSAIDQLCREALEYHFAAVCINPYYVSYCVQQLAPVIPVATVVGFPLGSTTMATKVAETRQVIAEGATEMDMVNGRHNK